MGKKKNKGKASASSETQGDPSGQQPRQQPKQQQQQPKEETQPKPQQQPKEEAQTRPQQQQTEQYGEAAGYQQQRRQGAGVPMGRAGWGRGKDQQAPPPGPPPGFAPPQQPQGPRIIVPPFGQQHSQQQDPIHGVTPVMYQHGYPQTQGFGYAPRVPLPQSVQHPMQGQWARQPAPVQQHYSQVQQPQMQQPRAWGPQQPSPYPSPVPSSPGTPTHSREMSMSPEAQQPMQQGGQGQRGPRQQQGQQQRKQQQGGQQQSPDQQSQSQPYREMSMSPEAQQPMQQGRGKRGPRQQQGQQQRGQQQQGQQQQSQPPLSRETSMSPEVQQPVQEDQRGRGPRQQQQGQGVAQPSPEDTHQPATPEEEATLGATSKQQQQPRSQGGGKKQKQPQQQKQQPQQGGAGESGVAEIQKSIQQISIRHGGGDVPIIQPQERNIMRKGGTKCRKKIMVLTNHFPLSLGKLNRAIHYDVVIEPDKPKKLFRDIMEMFRMTYYNNRHPAFDGMKNLYSAHQLCTSELSGKVKVKEDDREREYEVTIKQVAYVDLSCLRDYFKKIGTESLDKPTQALQCIDIILRSAPSLHCIPAGRSYFNVPVGTTVKLGDGTELYNGFYQSAILGWKPFLNLDVAHKAFPMQMYVVDYIYEITRNANPGSPLDRRDEETLKKHLRQLKVQYELPNKPGTKRIWRVNGLGDAPNRATFTDDKGRRATVENYFNNEKKVRLKFPNWPTLWVGSMQRANKILLPLEFCMILGGQAVNKKMTELQTRNMIKEAATSAPTRLAKIRESMAKAKYNLSPAVAEFGITVSEQPQEIQARVLEPPMLEYGRGAKEKVSRGVWRGTRFQTGVKIQTWTIICLDRRTDFRKLDDLEKLLIGSARKFGVDIPPAIRGNGRDFAYLEEDLRNPLKWKEKLIEYFRNSKFELIVVVVPDNSKNAYAFVKQAAEIAVGRLTQCIKARTVFRLNQTTTDNILLKINAKLNGVNHILSAEFQPSCFKQPIVIMGADVTHPSPDAQNIPSVAAVTCSYDVHGFKYIFSWRLQEPKLEIIKDLETIVMEQLRYFRERNRCAPQRIIFFRDGVSDGQFAEVRSSELRAIRNACMRLSASYKPQISFFVVQKRHHTRLFPINQSDSEDRNFNVPAGTCVDTVITRPSEYDFYLVSHASIQGVAKPTKYVPLWDDADMSEDEIQHLTFYLCHLFARCNRSVSYPTPTYYAHLAAARAKVYIETEASIDMTNLERVQDRLKVSDSIIRQLPMYFV